MFAAAVVAEVKAIACELPATCNVPISRWSLAELREEVIANGLAAEVSTSTVRRWLCEDAIRPWQHRSWIFPRDPDFAAKAARVLDLYARVFQGLALGSDEYVISADEKTSIQCRCRCHPSLPPGRTRVMRVEHEYERGGALAYLAAWDVHRAQLFARCEPTTGIEPFGRLVEQVMTVEPYASAKRVLWVVDNGSSHRGRASVDRLQGEWANLRLVHLPVHASWLNQIEIYFSVVQRKVLTPNDCTDLAEVEARLVAFQRRYEQTAAPFDWHFTRSDLDRLLRRLAEHEHPARTHDHHARTYKTDHLGETRKHDKNNHNCRAGVAAHPRSSSRLRVDSCNQRVRRSQGRPRRRLHQRPRPPRGPDHDRPRLLGGDLGGPPRHARPA